MRSSFGFLIVLAGSLLLDAQFVTVNTGTQASLWIRVDESGRQNASLAVRREAPAGLPQAFAEAVGCRAADLSKAKESYRPEVTCSLPATHAELHATLRWPLSRLNDALRNAGIDELDLIIDQSAGRGSSSRILSAAAMESNRHLSGWMHRTKMKAGAIEDVALEVGFPASKAWVLLFGAIAVALSPILLFFIPAELPSVQAGLRWLSLIVSTAWLWTLLYSSAPELLAMLASSPGLLLPPTRGSPGCAPSSSPCRRLRRCGSDPRFCRRNTRNS